VGAIVAVPFWANTEMLGYLKHVADEGGLEPGDVHRGEEAELFIDPSHAPVRCVER
jgi:hypothetical protein